MVFPLLENRIGGSSRHHFSNAARRIGQGAERNVVGAGSQHAGEYCRQGKADEQHFSVKIFLGSAHWPAHDPARPHARALAEALPIAGR